MSESGGGRDCDLGRTYGSLAKGEPAAPIAPLPPDVRLDNGAPGGPVTALGPEVGLLALNKPTPAETGAARVGGEARAGNADADGDGDAILDAATLKLPAICLSASSICARVSGVRVGRPVPDAAEGGGAPELRRDAGVAAATGEPYEGFEGELTGFDKLDDVEGTCARLDWAVCAATVGGCGSASSVRRNASISSCSAWGKRDAESDPDPPDAPEGVA